MNVKALIIHLQRATDRRAQVDRIAAACPVQAEEVEAVDGLTLDPDVIAGCHQRELFAPRYPFALRTAEIACFLSHRKCWQTIVDQGLSAALILEDDVEIDPEVFRPAYDLALRRFGTEDYVRFPQYSGEQSTCLLATSPTHRLFVPQVTGLGAVVQLVGIGAARRLLEATQEFDRPVDTFLQMTWQTGVRPICVTPAGISEVSAQLGGSRISRSKSFGEIVRREVLRPIYRRRIANLARRCA